VEYLGHLISGEGVRTDPRKTEAMQNWPTPTFVKALGGLLGLIGYYRKFIKNYGVIAAPLTALLKKDSFHWSSNVELAFNALKQSVSNPPVLALPDFLKPFVIECDASAYGLGAVLMQDNRPFAYHSEALKGRCLHLSTYEKELLALVKVVKKWRPYLVGNPFFIRTDQYSLKYILEQRIGTPTQQKWITKLLGYSFMVEYKKERENRAADALSRVQPSADSLAQDASLYLISFPCPMWLDLSKASYNSDVVYQDLLSKLADPKNLPPAGYSLQNGLILYKNKIYISPTSFLIPLILQKMHDNPIGGHSGYLKTLYRVKYDFYWQGMKYAIKDHIRCCEVCQRTKSDTSKPASLLQPFPIPDKPWLDISIDFIEGLPKSHGQDVIL